MKSLRMLFGLSIVALTGLERQKRGSKHQYTLLLEELKYLRRQ